MVEAALDDVYVDDIIMPATDRYPLGATLFLPRTDKRSHAVLINAATAVPRKVYRGFAGYLARRGCAVLIYDYRGIGDSRQKSLTGYNQMKSLAGFKADVGLGGQGRHCRGDMMRERYHHLPLVYVGHSSAAGVRPLPNNSEVSRAFHRGASVY